MIRVIGHLVVGSMGILFGLSLQDSWTLDTYKVTLLVAAALIMIGLALEHIFNRKRA